MNYSFLLELIVSFKVKFSTQYKNKISKNLLLPFC